VDDLELDLLKYEASHLALQSRIQDFTQATTCPSLDAKAEEAEQIWQELSRAVVNHRLVLSKIIPR